MAAAILGCSDGSDAPAADPVQVPGEDASVTSDAGTEPALDAAPDPSGEDTGAPAFDAGPLDAGPARLIEHVATPKDADPTVTTYNEKEYAYRDTRVPAKNKLVLYLAGASGVPQGTVPMLKEVASYGFHTIGIRYVNDYLIVDICAQDADPNCHGKLRLEALDGVDHSSHIQVPPQNAIEVRLAKLLVMLAAKFPAESWSQYLETGGALPKWSSIIVSGVSHGASASGRIGKVRATAGVVMLSGPYDNKAGNPAAWESEAPMTPVAKTFGFAHSADSQYSQDLENFAAMGLPGAATTVDVGAAPFGGSHRLTTSRAGGGHRSTIAGGGTPAAGGIPIYRPVWQLMFGP